MGIPATTCSSRLCLEFIWHFRLTTQVIDDAPEGLLSLLRIQHLPTVEHLQLAQVGEH